MARQKVVSRPRDVPDFLTLSFFALPNYLTMKYSFATNYE